MKFALRTSLCSSSDIAALVGRAKESGFDGVDVPAGASNLKMTAEAGLEIACLSADVSWSKRTESAATEEMKRCVDVAMSVGCTMVKISAPVVEGSLADAAVSFSDWLGAMAEQAGPVGIVLRNAGSFRTAATIWKILDRVGNRAGCCFDLENAKSAGESSAVAVPVLNSRIRLVQVGQVLESDQSIERLVKRLRGIGFEKFISLEEGVSVMREWTKRLEVSDAEAAAGVRKKK